jgi:hypothetical protein
MRGRRLSNVRCQLLHLQLRCLLHIKRSDWWRLKRLRSVNGYVSREFSSSGRQIRRTLLDDRDMLLSGDHLAPVSIVTAVRYGIRTLTAVWLVVGGVVKSWR